MPLSMGTSGPTIASLSPVSAILSWAKPESTSAASASPFRTAAIGFFGQLVLHHGGAGLGQVVGLDGGLLDSHFAVGGLVAGAGEGEVDRRAGREVRLGEVDKLVALVGDAHAGHDGVVVAGIQVGDDGVPVVGDPDAFKVGAAAELVAELALEAVDLAVVVDEVVGVVVALGAHRDLLGLGRAGEGEGE